jgi:LysR family cyn operon transcriptional activator
MLQRSRQLLSDADLLAEHARALCGGQTGTLKVAATPQIIANLLAPFLPSHRRHHPRVDVQLIEASASQQLTYLERREVHLAITPEGGGGLSYRLLSPVNALAVLLKTHPLSRRHVIEVEELSKFPLLLLQRGYGSRIWFDAACQSAQIRPLVLMESTTAHTLTELAAVAHGIAVVPSTSTIRDLLRAIPIVHRGTSIGFWAAVCWNKRRVLPPYAESFVDELSTHAARAFPGRKYIKRAPPLPPPSEL